MASVRKTARPFRPLAHRLSARRRRPHCPFHWLYAKREGGTFVLRIEDTDQDRNKSELVDGILASLKWLGPRMGRRPLLPVAADGDVRRRCKAHPRRRQRLRLLLQRRDVRRRRSRAGRYRRRRGERGRCSPAQQAAHAEVKSFKARAVPVPATSRTRKRAEKDNAGNPLRDPLQSAAHRLDRNLKMAVFGVNEVQNADIEDFVLPALRTACPRISSAWWSTTSTCASRTSFAARITFHQHAEAGADLSRAWRRAANFRARYR